MHQAIPYRSWRLDLDLHNPTTHHFTTQPLNIQSHSIDINNSNNNNNSDNKTKNFLSSVSPIRKGLASDNNKRMVLNMVSENAVIVFGRRGCCMSHVVKRLLLGLGVNPAVYEVDEKDEESVARELEAIVVADNNNNNNKNNIGNNKMQFPAVFIGGKLFGGLDRLMATHISGELVPMLKEAGALWL